jgi:tetratricopeptide (TPR) repeat protein
MVQPVAPRRSVGPIAVQLGLITGDQLAQAQAQNARNPGRSLDQTLIDLSLLTPDQVRSITREMNRGSSPPPPARAPAPAGRRPAPAPRPKAPTGRPSSSRPWLIPVVVAGVALLGIAGYLAFGSSKPKPEPDTTVKDPVKPPKETPKDPKKVEVAKDPPKEDPKKIETVRIRAKLQKVMGNSDLAARWNEAVDKINALRDPEQYKPVYEEMTAIIGAAKGDERADFQEGYREVLKAIRERAEQVFGFLADEVASLKAAGKFGDSLKTWDWFPGNLDLAGSFARKIEENQASAKKEANAWFATAMAEVESLVTRGKLEEAHLQLLRTLEIGIDDLYQKAEKRMTELTRLVDDAIKKKNEEELASFERMKAAEKEAAKTAALYQEQFWKFVSERQLDGARSFLEKQRQGATPEVGQALAAMDGALGEIRAALDVAGRVLSSQAGRTVSLAFLEGGRQQNRSFQLKGVRDGRIAYTVEGRELTVPLSDLHSVELAKLALGAAGEDRSLLEGVGRLLDNNFDEAHLHLTAAGSKAPNLVGFVEKSATFLARNVPVLKQRIERLVNEKNWEQAIQEYSKLSSVPAERKDALRGRARAYYQLNNFMAAVSDIESLFDMDDFSEPTLELLNQAFKRSALIDKAIRMYEKANARVPKNVSVLANLVALYMQIHEFQKAKDTLSRVKDVEGGIREIAGLQHLVDVALEPAFPGRTYKAQFGRYDLETNVSQEYATRMAKFMAKVYESYIKVFPYKKNETLRFHLKLFASEGEFFSYYKRTTGADPQGPYGKILAYYMPVTKELVGWNADGIEETLQHEGLHQYFDYFIADCPIWFNEGYASFFETSTADEVRFNPGRHPTALHLLETKQMPSLKEIFMMSGDVFRAKGALHYGSSWSVVYWFVKSGRKKILDRYFEALMEGKDQKQAFDAIFGPGKENVDEFDAKWRRAVRTENYDE